MKRSLSCAAWIVVLAGIALTALPAWATPQFTSLYSFTSSNGIYPEASLVQDTEGNFYGTTVGGGTAGDGTVYKITPFGALTTLVNFDGANGANPFAGLVQGSDGNFYGTTKTGGSSNDGTIFKMSSSGALTTLFIFSGTNGANPEADLALGSDGNFYGTTYAGGSSGYGTCFKITPSGALMTLVNFTTSNGAYPMSALVQASDGNFYGTTFGGYGTIFKMTPTGALTTLYSFTDGNDGAAPISGLIEGTDGNLYGTAESGGASDNGTAFKITFSGTFTMLYGFSTPEGGEPPAGEYPAGDLIQEGDGNFYGVTHDGTYGPGTVFKLTPSGTLTTLVTFNGTDGGNPFAGLTQGSDGNLYGTTGQGGTANDGTVFEIEVESQLLHGFTGADGALPRAALVQGQDGNYYGTTYEGGTSDEGTAFKITPSATLTTLVDFDFGLGAYPQSGLVLSPDGSFYGTTLQGGSSMYDGTLFHVSPSGSLNTLVDFTGANGENPITNLTASSSGAYYGTTYNGGTAGDGTVYMFTPSSGTITTLLSFTGANGAHPSTALVVGTDGNLYGTTEQGGSSSDGTVFKIVTNGTPSGTTLTTLVTFTGANGMSPDGTLLVGGDGNFYGTTFYGGTSNQGTIFEVTPAGSLTTLVDFDGANGEYPDAGLVLGSDGDFYGTTDEGGVNNAGIAFRLTTFLVYAGGHFYHYVSLATLCNFVGLNGTNPIASLVLGSDGDFYGTTYEGGTDNDGTVYRLNGPPQAEPEVSFTNENTPLTFPIGFIDPSGIGIDTIAFPNAPGHGTISFVPGSISETGTSGNGLVTYTPNAGFFGTDAFTCTVTGATGTSGIQTETIQVNQTPATVTVTPNPASVQENATQTFTATVKDAGGATFTPSSLTWSVSGGGAINAATGVFTAGTTPGTSTVTATATSNGVTQTGTASVMVTAITPTITSVSPTAGPVGSVVTITGTNFADVTRVRFHNASATTYSVNAAGTQITVTVPSGAGTGTITVNEPGETVISAQTFTVLPPPTITSISPSAGPVGSVVTITGTNFSDVTRVRFHNASATTYSVNAAGTQIIVTVPSGAGTGTITVNEPGETVTSTQTFTVLPLPTITSISPTSGPVGTVVTITGTNFDDLTRVRFHNASATTYSVNAAKTQITVTVPTGAGTGTITVNEPGITVISSQTFTVTH